jgi:hypothetical protein
MNGSWQNVSFFFVITEGRSGRRVAADGREHRIPPDVPSLSRRRRSDDSGTTEREAWEFGQAWNICSSFLLFNRLMTRLSLFLKGPQSALLWQGSNAAHDNKLGNQRREQDPG